MPKHQSFFSCASMLVQELQERTGMACFTVSRLTGGSQTFLYKKVAHPALDLQPSLPYRDSLCATMLELDGPRAVGDLRNEPAYAKTALAINLPVAAFISAPINIRPTSDRGTLFGTLCGFDPTPQSLVGRHLTEVERCAGHLGALLNRELGLADETRQIARERTMGRVATRGSWFEALKIENDRSWRYGDVTSVLVVETPDRQFEQTLELILDVTRPIDLVAAVDAGSLAILAPLCDTQYAQLMMRKLAGAADARKLEITAGHATREPQMTTDQTWLNARAAIEPLGNRRRADSSTPSSPDRDLALTAT